MVLSTHAVVGAAVIVLTPTHPILGTTLAFASHFLLDAIPHWDYTLYSDSLTPDKHGSLHLDSKLALDIVRIGGDAVLGLIVAWYFFSTPVHPYLWFFGASAAIFPDFLQFVYAKWRHEPFTSLQRFHDGIQKYYKIKNPVLGEGVQLALIAAVIALSR